MPLRGDFVSVESSAGIPSDMNSHLDELLELEHAGWRSLCSSTGADFYGRTMTSDGLMVLANGEVMTRSDVVTALEHAPAWDSYSIDDVVELALGDAAVSLVYTGVGRRQDGGEFTGIMSSTYVNDGGEWRLALYQQTPKSG